MLRLRRRTLGAEHPDTLMTVTELAAALEGTGDVEAALRHLQRAVPLLERLQGPEDLRSLQAAHQLGATLAGSGDLAGAIKRLRQVVQRSRAALGPGHADTFARTDALAQVSMASCFYSKKSNKYGKENLKIVIGSLLYISVMLMLVYHKRSFTLCKIHIRDERMRLPRCWRAAATTPARRGSTRRRCSSGSARCARRTRTRSPACTPWAPRCRCGTLHRHPAACRARLCCAWSGFSGLRCLPQGASEHAAAARQHARALRLRRAALGAEHPDTLRSMHALGAALDSAGDHAAAAKRLERAVRGREKVLGLAHEDTAQTAYALGAALITLGRFAAAAQRFEQAAEAMEQLHGPDNKNALDAVQNQAMAVLLGGDQWEAARHLQRVARLRQKALGPQHAETLNSMLVLSYVLGAAGQAAAAGQYESLQAWMPKR